MTLSNAFHFIGGAAVSAVLAVAVSTAMSKNAPQSFDQYQTLIDEVPVLLNTDLADSAKSLMKRSMQAHHDQDSAALIADLGDDYSFYSVSADGPAALAESKEIAAEMTVNLYQSDYMKNYAGVKSTPIAIVGNIGIQLDVEAFEFKDGSREEMTILSLFETEDGKLKRLWAFYPDVGEAE